MADPEFDADASIRALAPVLGLDLTEERIAAVAPFLTIAAEMAAILEAAPVPKGTLALAPVYTLPAAEEER
ncbi:AtzG-like protein [Thalassobaculum sp. OXR-137]|uniref:AtzG-like protein n=1 Tax=Thalassobaculum sp. OXR-137 TaxID=3100173 RepID=UPI002AC89B4B|nr:AtzG-like protein [Thalassobaculum sp. OXR-137]WPZ34569.1 AtzG-like protein [Thalassobaculum sp. OXR-137]